MAPSFPDASLGERRQAIRNVMLVSRTEASGAGVIEAANIAEQIERAVTDGQLCDLVEGLFCAIE